MPKRDPMTSVMGYMESRIASRVVGRKGDRRAVIFLAVEGLLWGSCEPEGEGGRFCILAERRGVTFGESISEAML